MRRFGLIGDVHAEHERLAAALERLSRERVDAILCVGDIADGRGDVDRCVELLRRYDVITVRGNHDRWCAAGEIRNLPEATSLAALAESSRRFLTELPATRRLETAFGPLLLAHGLGGHDMLNVSDRRALEFQLDPLGRVDGLDPDICIHVGGHTHQRWVEQVGRLTMVNAGTLREDACFGLLDLDAGCVQWFDFENGPVVVSAFE